MAAAEDGDSSICPGLKVTPGISPEMILPRQASNASEKVTLGLAAGWAGTAAGMTVAVKVAVGEGVAVLCRTGEDTGVAVRVNAARGVRVGVAER
jgi:hypothetical protein